MINWARVAELYSDFGEDSFAEIVDVFLAEVAEGLDKLRGAEDAKTLRAEFHFLKGAALNLGFDDIAAQCGEGEARAAAGSDSSAQKAQILADLPAACEALARDWREKLTAAP